MTKEITDPKKCSISCRYVFMEMNYPRTRGDAETYLWYLYHKDCEVFVDNEGEWFLAVLGKCRHLTKDKRCAIKKRQPEICSHFSGSNGNTMKKNTRLHFKTEREILSYFKERRPALFAKLHPDTKAAAGS